MLQTSRRLRPLFLALFVALALASLALAACGDDDDDSGTPAASDGTPGNADSSATEIPGQSDENDGAGSGNSVATVRWEELQCQENPWQEDWATANPGSTYPTEESDDLDVFQDYWRDQELLVFQPEIIPLAEGTAVIQQCGSPSGRFVQTSIPANQSEAAVAAGFELVVATATATAEAAE